MFLLGDVLWGNSKAKASVLPSHSGFLMPLEQQVHKGIGKLIALLTMISMSFYGCCHITEACRSVLGTEGDHCGICWWFYAQK